MSTDGVDGTDWDAYYTTVRTREPRDTLLSALAAFGPDGTGLHAVDLGCGDGTDTLALLAAGWRVTAVDGSAAFPAHLEPRVAPADRDRLEVVVADYRSFAVPPCDLVHAGFSVYMCAPDLFAAMWASVRAALRPGGRVAVHLLGDKDSWALEGRPDMTWQDRAGVDALLAGLDVERLEETEEDGWSYLGEKHWHLWRVLARAPG